MAAIPAIMMSGALLSAIGAISQANATQAASSYNASINEQQAATSLEQADRDAAQVRREGAQVRGSIVAGYGASGVVSDDGSPLDVLSYSAAQSKLDEETILYKGRMKATGYQSAAALERFSGDTAQEQGYLSAASYLVGGAGKAGASYAMTQRPYLYYGE